MKTNPTLTSIDLRLQFPLGLDFQSAVDLAGDDVRRFHYLTVVLRDYPRTPGDVEREQERSHLRTRVWSFIALAGLISELAGPEITSKIPGLVWALSLDPQTLKPKKL